VDANQRMTRGAHLSVKGGVGAGLRWVARAGNGYWARLMLRGPGSFYSFSFFSDFPFLSCFQVQFEF
jgi:hypothetical protein